ncbi:hypothetical protein GR925_19260 [Streptomyces sp. HUCO-GS316]|uniref:hypothetical protein n=1 Tax=Streptomyces sp. HUCO-GS316 TaxID=2692198 RepID=UPI00136B1814|nr:hypothetical protein [Streptomyces sp. HUCO-GS316]MXM65533.1 hypothetical protein [Streptomyces sp. HUCO-GS316]
MSPDDMTEDEARATLARIFKERGTPGLVRRDDDGTVRVEEVDILDILRSQLGKDARLLDSELLVMSEEQIEQFRKEARDTFHERVAARLNKHN